MRITDDNCLSVCWIGGRGIDAECSLPPSHDGNHWDQIEGWEW